MAQNRIRPTVGSSEEHLRRTPLGSGQYRVSLFHIFLANNGVQSLRAQLIHWIRYPWWSYDLLLGKRPMVNGEPVQLGQTSGTLRNLHHLSRTHLSDTSRHVPRGNSRDRALCSYGRAPRLGDLPSAHQRRLACGYLSLRSDACISLCNGNGTIIALLGIWPRGRFCKCSSARASIPDLWGLLSLDRRVLPVSTGRASGSIAYSSHTGNGCAKENTVFRARIRRTLP